MSEQIIMTTLAERGAFLSVKQVEARLVALYAVNLALGGTPERTAEIRRLEAAVGEANGAIPEDVREARDARNARRRENALSKLQSARQRIAEGALPIAPEELERIVEAARVELKTLPYGSNGSGTIEYLNRVTNKVKLAEFWTRDGFLRGQLKYHGDPEKYVIYSIEGDRP